MSGLALGLDVVMVAALVLGLASAGRFLGPRPRHEGDADLPFETGERPFAPASDRMAVLYQRFAVLFVVFDVDLAFLLPWATNRRGADLGQLLAVTFLVGTVGLMLAYFWRKGALECR